MTTSNAISRLRVCYEQQLRAVEWYARSAQVDREKLRLKNEFLRNLCEVIDGLESNRDLLPADEIRSEIELMLRKDPELEAIQINLIRKGQGQRMGSLKFDLR